eukprot:5700782-Pleurochrysis_carterae.AAC.1
MVCSGLLSQRRVVELNGLVRVSDMHCAQQLNAAAPGIVVDAQPRVLHLEYRDGCEGRRNACILLVAKALRVLPTVR